MEVEFLLLTMVMWASIETLLRLKPIRILCDDIAAKTNFKAEVYSDPQTVHLPFVVEERIVQWELQGYTNSLVDDESGDILTDALGGEQFFFTFYIKLRKLKTKKKMAGGFRIVSSAAGGAAAMNVNP
jgi:hypothetical protein